MNTNEKFVSITIHVCDVAEAARLTKILDAGIQGAQDTQSAVWLLQRIAEAGNKAADLAAPAEPQRVYLVCTGETHEGQETYTRHDVRPPLCDAETLYTAPDDQPEQSLTELFAEIADLMPQATVEDNSQNWAGMDGACAWHLIERHADGWADIGKMMGEWLAANQQQPSADSVPMPQNAAQAELMAKLGMAWLQQHAPERLVKPAAASGAALEHRPGEITLRVNSARAAAALQLADSTCPAVRAARDALRGVPPAAASGAGPRPLGYMSTDSAQALMRNPQSVYCSISRTEDRAHDCAIYTWLDLQNVRAAAAQAAPQPLESAGWVVLRIGGGGRLCGQHYENEREARTACTHQGAGARALPCYVPAGWSGAAAPADTTTAQENGNG